VTGKALCIGALSIMLVGAACSTQPQPDAAKPPSPEALLQAIPAADLAQVDRIHDMKNWRNPYLIVRPDGVALLDAANSAEIKLKPDELLPALAALPASNWPLGRVVAAAEEGASGSGPDGAALRRIKGIVGGELRGAQVAIKWVPSG